MKSNRWPVSIVLVVMAIIMSACGGSEDSKSSSGQPNATQGSKPPEGGVCTEERKGGSVTMGVFGETVGLDPVVSGGAGVTGGTEMAALYDSLMRFNPDTGEYDAWVAESLEANDDSTVWTLTLQDGVEFGNGDPLTAEAVQASIKRHQDPDASSRWLGMTLNIAEMEVLDDLTLEFTLTEPFGMFPYVLAAEPGLIVNVNVIEELGEEVFNLNPVGAGVGPFEIVRFAPGEEIRMKAKEDYWGGPVCIESLAFVDITGAQANLDALKKDELQAAFLREPLVIDQARSDGFADLTTLQHGGELLVINSGVQDSDPATADVRVRRAIAHALDTSVIDQRVNEGTGIAGSALFPEQSRFYQGLEGPAYDPELASSLVEEVKAEGSWDGTIRFSCDNAPMRIETAITVQAMLEAVGFKVEVNNGISIGELIQQVRMNHDYEIACWGLNATEALPWVKFDELYRSDNESNHTGYANEDFDAALADLKAAADLDDQIAALKVIQEVWNETIPSIVLTTSEESIFVSDSLKGVVAGHNAYTYFDEAYLES